MPSYPLTSGKLPTNWWLSTCSPVDSYLRLATHQLVASYPLLQLPTLLYFALVLELGNKLSRLGGGVAGYPFTTD